MPKKFSPELRDRAVRMVYDRQVREGGPRAASIRAVAPQLGVGTETLRIWCNRYGPTEPAGPGEPLEEENRRLRRELAEARRANEILKAASAFFGSSRFVVNDPAVAGIHATVLAALVSRIRIR